MSASPEHMEAEVWSTLRCGGCGRALSLVVTSSNVGAGYLVCEGRGCVHAGKRWRVPTLTLTRLPDAKE